MKQKTNKKLKKTTKKWLVAFLIIILLIGSLLLPTKYLIEGPGPLDELSKYISIKPEPKHTGRLYSTSVTIRPALFYDYLFYGLTPNTNLVSKQEVYGNGTSTDWDKISDFEMHLATTNATFYAAKKAKIPVKKDFVGLFVIEVQPTSDFQGKLEVGDIITKVDGQTFKSVAVMQKYIKNRPLQAKLKLTVKRDKKILEIEGKTTRLAQSKQSGIGITLGEYLNVLTTPKVGIKVDDLSGPSAGLMFTLELYQEFTGVDLTRGQKIAGTGTIDQKGKVGIIGGVDKKVAGADAAGAKVFFAPVDQPEGTKKSETNYAEAVKTAKALKTKMKIVPVKNFEDALNYLTRQK